MKTKQFVLFPISFILALLVSLSVSGQIITNPVKPVVDERTISEFHTLHVSGLAVVYLVPAGDTNKVKLIVSGMPIEDVLTTINNGVLKITTQGIHNGENIKVYVSNPNIKNITVAGAGILYNQNTLKVNKLSITVIGNGAAQLAVNAKELEINMKGGDLKITGVATRYKINRLKDHDHGTLERSGLKGENL